MVESLIRTRIFEKFISTCLSGFSFLEIHHDQFKVGKRFHQLTKRISGYNGTAEVISTSYNGTITNVSGNTFSAMCERVDVEYRDSNPHKFTGYCRFLSEQSWKMRILEAHFIDQSTVRYSLGGMETTNTLDEVFNINWM
jgi:hypothetical protein